MFFEIEGKESEIWFDINHIPIKWHLPIGVIVDSLVKDQSELPICITLHTKNFPDQNLFRYKGNESLRFLYFNSLKEACSVKTGSAKDILNLSTKETNRLFDIISNPTKMYKDFLEIERKIYTSEIKAYPIKIVLNNTEIVINKQFNIEEYGDCSLEEYIEKSFPNTKISNLIRNNDLCNVLCYSNAIDLRVPILFLVANFTMNDGFLYIIINERK